MIILFLCGTSLQSQDDVRRTQAVDVLEKATPAVGVVYAFKDQGRQNGAGSCSVIDPRGYVLTAKHVVGEQHIIVLGGRPPLRASLIGTMPEFDVAILKLGRSAYNRPGAPAHPREKLPLDFLQLGVDSEIRVGETVFNVGSPGARGIVATKGIVSAVAFSGVNPLSLSLQSSTAFDELIQFDAASNKGNSGGPLIDMLGQQIGMAVSGVDSEEGVHFALPAKTIRYSIPEILCNELRLGYTSGIEIDPQASTIKIIEIKPKSSASKADLQVGDQILSINGRSLRDPIDWEFSKATWAAGQEVRLSALRGQKLFDVSLQLDKRIEQPGVDVPDVEPGLICKHSAYDPTIPSPLDDQIRPNGVGKTIETVQAHPEFVEQAEHYELLIEGLLKIENAGRYRLGLKSDDGSKLFVHDQLLIDNNGNHAAKLRTGWVNLAKGFHPIRIEFYEDQGEEVLEFLWASNDEELTPVPPATLFHHKNGEGGL